MRAHWNGMTMAEADDIVEVEGNHYLPRASLSADLVRESSTTSVCSSGAPPATSGSSTRASAAPPRSAIGEGPGRPLWSAGPPRRIEGAPPPQTGAPSCVALSPGAR